MVYLYVASLDGFQIFDVSFKNLVFKLADGVFDLEDIFGTVEDASPNGFVLHHERASAVHLVVPEITLITIKLTRIPSIDTLLLLSLSKTTHKHISVRKFLHAVGSMRKIVQPSPFV